MARYHCTHPVRRVISACCWAMVACRVGHWPQLALLILVVLLPGGVKGGRGAVSQAMGRALIGHQQVTLRDGSGVRPARRADSLGEKAVSRGQLGAATIWSAIFVQSGLAS
ncbi:hypothetical protein Cs7R123_06410 [Catellatospora sp. TT07R-123]|nr:hypothetical protein Cs7R123_06410 [Catellatospora sp. TT07R-123]